ncbi:MAG: hypothetical protein ACYDEO_18055, partial [Aggregatilineales bacterium]
MPSKADFVNRPPHIQSYQLPEGEIKIPNPPSSLSTLGRLGLLTVALPLVTIFGYAFIGGQSQGLLFIVPMALSVIATSVVALITWRRNQQLDRQRREN